MPPTDPPAALTRRRRAHWAWFWVWFAALSALGAAAATAAMLPLAMATDPCHDGTPDRICRLSAAGQNMLMLIPWLALLVGVVLTGGTAALAGHRRRSPLLAFPVGIIGYLAAIPLGWHVAFTV